MGLGAFDHWIFCLLDSRSSAPSWSDWTRHLSATAASIITLAACQQDCVPGYAVTQEGAVSTSETTVFRRRKERPRMTLYPQLPNRQPSYPSESV